MQLQPERNVRVERRKAVDKVVAQVSPAAAGLYRSASSLRIADRPSVPVMVTFCRLEIGDTVPPRREKPALPRTRRTLSMALPGVLWLSDQILCRPRRTSAK